MILCDTNILIEFYKNNSQVISELHFLGINQLAISSITQAELYYGTINNVELRKIKNHLKLVHLVLQRVLGATTGGLGQPRGVWGNHGGFGATTGGLPLLMLQFKLF
ncbi:MAG: hypothetical protein ACKO3K_19470 [Cuspidothrix sp.]